MPNYGTLITGQQAVTTVPTALPSVIPPNPYGAAQGNAGSVPRGEGVDVKLTCIGSAALFYGNNASVSPTNGKAIAAGASSDALTLNDLAQIFVVSAGNGTSTASWSVTNR